MRIENKICNLVITKFYRNQLSKNYAIKWNSDIIKTFVF